MDCQRPAPNQSCHQRSLLYAKQHMATYYTPFNI
jgi:hypothetical protein